jgi:hypothetical protein
MKRLKLRIGTVLAVLAAAMIMMPALGHASVEYGFSSVISDPWGVAGQFSMKLEDMGSGVSRLTFSNVGNINSVITSIYFDAPTSFSMTAAIAVEHNVDFVKDGNPGTFPQGANLTPKFETLFSFSAVSSPVKNGVEDGISNYDYLSLEFRWSDVNNTTSTYDALMGLIATGDLRVGLHVQDLASMPFPGSGGKLADSNAYVNNVPIPGAAYLMGSGLIALLGLRKKRSS